MNQEDSDHPPAAPPAAAGPAGARLEGMVGAFYFLALLGQGEPRGLPGAVARKVRFQQSAHGRPLDDVTVDAVNADGTDAFLDIQAKRTIDFTVSNQDFADVVRRLWATAQKPAFATTRYELAVAIARTSTRIERHCQQVLQWARQLADGEFFAAHMQQRGFASDGMRAFVEAFRHHLANAGAPTDDETVWRLLRRFKILVFDFESPGSDYDHRAREQGRALLAPGQAARAAELWSILIDEALACDAAGGEVDRTTLADSLAQKYGLQIGPRPDLHAMHARISEAAEHALADIRDNIGGARLSREQLIDATHEALAEARMVQIVGSSGVGKSGVLKALAMQERSEGTVLVLAPGRIVTGGWLQMAHVIGCPPTVTRDELFNELGCGGNAILFVDNIDQIDDADAWLTLRDLLRSVMQCQGWRAVFTVRSDAEEWRVNLPDEMRQLSFRTIRVSPLTDAEADVLRANNRTLAALLSPTHPARAITRNLFHLSRLVDLAPATGESVANELDLARLWWRFGGGRTEAGRFERLRLLRNLGERLIRAPGLTAFSADELNARTIEELLAVDTLREDRAGATVAFGHDTLRDWTIGFLLEERPDLQAALPLDRPLPGTLARGLEIAARLALESDATGAQWLALLALFERDGCHGSWRRPVLMALPRSENAFELFMSVEPALIADNGRRLKEIIKLMLAVETVPIAQFLARARLPTPEGAPDTTQMVIPTGTTWMPVVVWAALRTDDLPSTLIPDLAKLFQLWLMATQAQQAEINRLVVQRLYEWLTRIEEAQRPIAITDIRDAPDFELDFEHIHQVHEDIRMTFLSFGHLNPQCVQRYLADTSRRWHRGASDILKFAGTAARAAPAELADFALAALIPEEDEDDLYRRRRDRFGPFSIYDHQFMPVSPGQGPFFLLLQESPPDGLRLVRGIVEHATQWQRDSYAEEVRTLPVLTIPFPEGAKSFAGDFGTYEWARGGTGSLVVASALMALEAWAHRQIESGHPTGEVLHEVLGPTGSSVAFVCVAVDLVLSHWPAIKGAAWPMLAAPELLQYDHMRLTQDQSGMGRFFAREREAQHWPVRSDDLLRRPSRRYELIDKAGDYALYGPADVQTQLRGALIAARDRFAQDGRANEEDPILGLRATAERALRMNHAEHWQSTTIRGRDGQEIEAYQYQLPVEEIELRQAAVRQSQDNIAQLNIRVGLQRALTEPQHTTPQFVEQGIAWARARNDQPGADDYDAQWEARAVVMAAALAARDYEGADRTDVEAWSRTILHAAATEQNDEIYARTGEQIWSSKRAIAAVGYRALYCRCRDDEARDALLRLVARQDHPVLHAVAGGFPEFNRVDERFSRALTRVAMQTAGHPRRTLDPARDGPLVEAHHQRIEDAIQAEMRWLDGEAAEPPWPELTPWHSRRRRGIRLGPAEIEDEREWRMQPPEMYVDEHALGILANYLIGFMIGEIPAWVPSLLAHLMPWTIEANNGPPGDDEHERDNRPLHWNISYFDVLGILCVALPFERARGLLIEPIMTLHDEAFFDAMAAFLRGFDRATLAPDMPRPENAAGVRSLFVERLRRSRRMEDLNDRQSFRAEVHLGDALTALFYQPARFMHAGRPHIPEHWDGLFDVMHILTPIVTSAPQSGYLAVLFLTLIESNPSPAFLPAVVAITSAWCEVHPVGANFWTNEHQLGHRICEWITRALDDEVAAAPILHQVRDDLGRCLDVLVRSGIASARTLEGRLSGRGEAA